MVAVGVILVLIAVGGGGYLGYLAAQTSADVVVGSTSTSIALTMLPITLYSAGVASVVLLWLGWKLTRIGFRRKRAQRRELKDLRATGGSGGSTPTGTSGADGSTP